MNLTERRAEFVYDAARLAAIAAEAPVVPLPWGEREQPFRERYLKVVEKRCRRSYEEARTDLVSYWKLGELERNEDDMFVLLCHIAHFYIR